MKNRVQSFLDSFKGDVNQGVQGEFPDGLEENLLIGIEGLMSEQRAVCADAVRKNVRPRDGQDVIASAVLAAKL